MPDKNGTDIATMYVGHYGIEPQAEGEDNRAFRSRVAGVLRANGLLIDAHEAYANKYHDEVRDSESFDDPMMGIIGGAALEMSGQKSCDIGHDMAAGLYVQQPVRPQGDEALLLLALALGGR